MKFRATLLDAINEFSVRPVVVLGHILDPAPDLSDRISGLSLYLSPENDPAPRNKSNGSENPNTAISNLAVKLQEAAGIPDMRVVFKRFNENEDEVGYECLFLETGQQVLRAVKTLLELEGNEAELRSSLKRSLRSLREYWAPRVSHFAVHSATRLGIPWTTIKGQSPPLFALGHGVHRQLFWRHMSPETSEIAVVFSTPKNISSRILHSVGVPVPQQVLVHDVDAALRAARRLGWPVVTKPAKTDFGTGITTLISDTETLKDAYTEAKQYGDVLIEKHIDGTNHRLLVHQAKCISAIRQRAAQVMGDGVHSINELIAQTNVHRTEGLSENWKKIIIDDGLVFTLKRQGLTLKTTPATGQSVMLRNHTNLSQGGTMENITQDVHPENRNFAEMAAAAFGLDLAGVDMITTDITRPLFETGGAVVEVNATPALVMGEADNLIEDQIITHHFPAPSRGSIPIIACVESDPSYAHIVADMLRKSGRTVALASPNGISVGPNRITGDGETPLPRRTAIALANCQSEAAVLSFRAEEFLSRGLGADRLSVAVGSSKKTPKAFEALVALDRASKSTVLFLSDLNHFLQQRVGFGPVWCILDGAERLEIDDVSTIRKSTESAVIVRPANESAFEVKLPLSSKDYTQASVILAVAYSLGMTVGDNSAFFA